jgi:hypothetical protein
MLTQKLLAGLRCKRNYNTKMGVKIKLFASCRLLTLSSEEVFKFENESLLLG